MVISQGFFLCPSLESPRALLLLSDSSHGKFQCLLAALQHRVKQFYIAPNLERLPSPVRLHRSAQTSEGGPLFKVSV